MTEIDPASLLIGVVAHRSRLRAANALVKKTQAQVLNIDETRTTDQSVAHVACANNHLKVLRHLRALAFNEPSPGKMWCILIEDDGLPIDNFRSHAAAALRYAPTQLIGFYIGRAGNIETLQTAYSLKRAWVTTDYMISAVAYAIRADVLDQLLDHYPKHDPAASPEVRFTTWCRSYGWRFSYTVPSLVDHSDGKSLIFTENDTVEIRQIRKAWMLGAAPDWKTTALQY